MGHCHNKPVEAAAGMALRIRCLGQSRPVLPLSFLIGLAVSLFCSTGGVILAARSVNAAGESPLVIRGMDQDGRIHLNANCSLVLTTARPYRRVSVGQPDVLDFNAIAPTSILLTAKRPGQTQLIVWDDNEFSQMINVTVTADQQGLQSQLRMLFPDARIETTCANGVVVLRGQVPNLDIARQAGEVAAPYGTKVVNLLEVGGVRQVMLQVRFAEVSRSALSSLGINGAFADGAFVGASNIGQVNPFTAFTPGHVGDTPSPSGADFGRQNISPSVTLFGAGQVGSFYLQAFVNALRSNNLLRILAEPNLIAISGEEASFLAGGEFPIPVPQANGGASSAITIEFREFGVKLLFLPTVLGDGRIRLKVSPEVSDLDYTTAVRFSGFVVPGLMQRKVSTTIELIDGQSFAIAGLLNNTTTAGRDAVPLLGDLPVIGALFRSVRYQRKETELVVLVTPRLVAPLGPGRIPALPGAQWRHPTENELFWKQDLGGPVRPAPAATQPVSVVPRLFHGQYGFAPADLPAGPVAGRSSPSHSP